MFSFIFLDVLHAKNCIVYSVCNILTQIILYSDNCEKICGLNIVHIVTLIADFCYCKRNVKLLLNKGNDQMRDVVL